MHYFRPALYALLLLSACVSEISDRSLTWIEISTNDGWLLMVDADGSGYLAYGQLSGQRVHFPAATFDFGELRRDIRDCRSDYPGRHALVSRIFSARDVHIEQYYCLDTLIGREWLGAAYEAIPLDPREPARYRRLCRRWRADPPLVME